jgi:Ca2+-binding RTX toxin-like protein
MARFTGTAADETITPAFVSPTVTRRPAGSFPGNGSDRLDGRGGDDTLESGGGADILIGGTGADDMTGGSGSDLYSVDNAGDSVTELANGGIDTVHASISYTLAANVENLVLAGTGFAPLDGTGNGLGNVIVGNAGDNVLSGLAGNDVLEGGAGDDTLRGGDGNDVLEGGLGNDSMSGGLGDDVYVLVENGDVAGVGEVAGGGFDTVEAFRSYTLTANMEKLQLLGTGDLNGAGNDLANQIFGNFGDNILAGKGGNDLIDGGSGDDTINAGDGADNVRGGSGKDTLAGGLGNDKMNGDAGADSIAGGAGDDQLAGGDGNDVLVGANDNDLLNGNAGDNTLTGGAGLDTFRFDTPLVAGDVSTITDFIAADDRFVLDNAIFTEAGALGPLAAGAFFTGAAAHDADDRIIYNSVNGNVMYDADGAGGQAAIVFARVDAGLPISANDFRIV